MAFQRSHGHLADLRGDRLHHEIREKQSPGPNSVWLLGAVCVPSAWRRKWKTIMMRTKGVIESSSAGNIVSSVSTRTIVQACEFPVGGKLMSEMLGARCGAAQTVALLAAKTKAAATAAVPASPAGLLRSPA